MTLAERARAALTRITHELEDGDYYDGVLRGTHRVSEDLQTIREALAAKAAADQEREELAQYLERFLGNTWVPAFAERAKIAQAARLLRTPAPVVPEGEAVRLLRKAQLLLDMGYFQSFDLRSEVADHMKLIRAYLADAPKPEEKA